MYVWFGTGAGNGRPHSSLPEPTSFLIGPLPAHRSKVREPSELSKLPSQARAISRYAYRLPSLLPQSDLLLSGHRPTHHHLFTQPFDLTPDERHQLTCALRVCPDSALSMACCSSGVKGSTSSSRAGASSGHTSIRPMGSDRSAHPRLRHSEPIGGSFEYCSVSCCSPLGRSASREHPSA